MVGGRLPHLQLELLDLFFNLDRVLGLGDGRLPHAVGKKGEEPLHHLREETRLRQLGARHRRLARSEAKKADLSGLSVLHVGLAGGKDGLQHVEGQEPSSQVAHQRDP